MGIAGFYLWLQRWYAECIDDIPEEVVQAALDGRACPDNVASKYRYDNLYIDMNGLIHPCCHDTHPLPEPSTETEMFQRIFEQLDLLVKVVRPRKCLILCIDGVAPRSKMNQQRSRRFRAAEERIESDQITLECAKTLMNKYHLPRPHVKQKWDHNVITPSTTFMERIGLAVEWFVMKKLNEDPAWRMLCVVFSDAHVPGEGEHKIMQYIRGLRVQPGYHHKTSHVIHGMDADLVCLGLSTHEPHVSILRNQLNEVYGPDYNKFCYFNLYSYRQHLMRDFGNIDNMEFERVIDDFVFLCFFVGNDFLPHVPLISIKTKGIELLLDHYVRDFSVHSYLTHGGNVDFAKLHSFLNNFVASKMNDLRKEYHGVLRAKERAKINVNERVGKAEKELEELLSSLPRSQHERQEVSDQALSLMTSIIKERTRLVADQQPLCFSYLDEDYRDKYYIHKFNWDCSSRNEFERRITQCCAEYFRGMQWVMWYYTKGCPSWEWYYPYHYAPLLQDLARFNDRVNVSMKMSSPLHPVEQLLAVLPRLSVQALPEALHDAVNDPHSPLGPFYPDKVDVDVSEANFSYQGVLRIPFIDSHKLHTACNKLVELEEDVGTTLLFCHHNNPLRAKLEHLLSSHRKKIIDYNHNKDEDNICPCESLPCSRKHTHASHKNVADYGNISNNNNNNNKKESSQQHRQEEQCEELVKTKSSVSDNCLSFPMVCISQPIASSVPIAGHIGHYEAAWTLHARLDCPDREIAHDTSFGKFIANNSVHMYRYELNTQALYVQDLLESSKRAWSASNIKAEHDYERHESEEQQKMLNMKSKVHQQQQETKRKKKKKEAKKSKVSTLVNDNNTDSNNLIKVKSNDAQTQNAIKSNALAKFNNDYNNSNNSNNVGINNIQGKHESPRKRHKLEKDYNNSSNQINTNDQTLITRAKRINQIDNMISMVDRMSSAQGSGRNVIDYNNSNKGQKRQKQKTNELRERQNRKRYRQSYN